MLNRRRFISDAVAVATTTAFARLPELRAAQYDLLIIGGRVIDPFRKFDQTADVAIAGGSRLVSTTWRRTSMVTVATKPHHHGPEPPP